MTYANVMATVAMFLALGGSAYAISRLPANSVGSKQLRDGAVITSKLADRAVTGANVAEYSLTGTQISSRFLAWAVVDANGQLLHGRGVIKASSFAPGGYVVYFRQSVAHCAYSASVVTLPAGDPYSAYASVAPADNQPGQLVVDTFWGFDGSMHANAFSLLVAC